MSRQLRALEEELGATLIVRSTRRLHVTEAGRRWYAHSARVLADVEQARASVRDGERLRGTLVVSASLTFGSLMIVPRLKALAAKYPELVIDLRLEDRLSDLVGEGVDLAVRAGLPPPDSTAYVARPLLTMRRVVVASPALLKQQGALREPRQLARRVCVVQVTPAGSTIEWRLQRGEEEQTPEVRGPVRSNAPLVLRDLALAGVGLAYLPDFVVSAELARGRLRRVLPEWESPLLTAWAVHRAELRGAPRLRAFLDAMAPVSA